MSLDKKELLLKDIKVGDKEYLYLRELLTKAKKLKCNIFLVEDNSIVGAFCIGQSGTILRPSSQYSLIVKQLEEDIFLKESCAESGFVSLKKEFG
jgi:hypothetical protein